MKTEAISNISLRSLPIVLPLVPLFYYVVRESFLFSHHSLTEIDIIAHNNLSLYIQANLYGWLCFVWGVYFLLKDGNHRFTSYSSLIGLELSFVGLLMANFKFFSVMLFSCLF